MFSAVVGSVLTSLIVTPFDVVRVRLQQQEMLYPPGSQGQECRKAFWEEDIVQNAAKTAAEACACGGGDCVEEAKVGGTVQGIRKIASNEGILALYRGMTLTLLMAVPSNIVYFSGYELLRDNSPLKQYSVLNPLVCGAFARILAATSVAPLELIRTRLQAVPSVQRNTRSSTILKMVLRNTLKEIRSKGPLSMFKGLQLTLWRDVPFSAIYWSTYESLSSRLKKTTYLNVSKDNADDNLNKTIFARSFIAGSISGVTAALFTNPFDVGKTRFQVSSEADKPYGTLEPLSNPSGHTGIPGKKESMFQFLYKIYKYEGFTALYVGLAPRCLKIAPSCAIMISTYEVCKNFFADVDEKYSSSKILHS